MYNSVYREIFIPNGRDNRADSDTDSSLIVKLKIWNTQRLAVFLLFARIDDGYKMFKCIRVCVCIEIGL